MNQSILQQGRLACLEATRSTAQQNQVEGTVYLLTIAQDLERTLQKDPECCVQWVSVIDEPSSFGPPTREWKYDDFILQVSLAQGNSEGMLVYVFAQADRYKPADLVPLLRIKLLCGPARAVREVQAIWTYLNDSPEFVKAKTPA